MTGEEAFLRGLYELASGQTQFKISRLVFGGNQSTQFRLFQFFIHHLYDNFHTLLTDNLQWLYDSGLVELSAALIQEKMSSHVVFNEGLLFFSVCLSLSACLSVCVCVCVCMCVSPNHSLSLSSSMYVYLSTT